MPIGFPIAGAKLQLIFDICKRMVKSPHKSSILPHRTLFVNISKNTCLWGGIYRGWNFVKIPLWRVCGASTEPVRRPSHARLKGRKVDFCGKSDCECKDTLIFSLFPNFLAKKCKKLVFCNVEMTKRGGGSESSVCSPSSFLRLRFGRSEGGSKFCVDR